MRVLPESQPAHGALIIAFAFWAPSVGVPLLTGVFVVFAFGSLRMKYRQTVVASVAIAVAIIMTPLHYIGKRGRIR